MNPVAIKKIPQTPNPFRPPIKHVTENIIDAITYNNQNL